MSYSVSIIIWHTHIQKKWFDVFSILDLIFSLRNFFWPIKMTFVIVPNSQFIVILFVLNKTSQFWYYIPAIYLTFLNMGCCAFLQPRVSSSFSIFQMFLLYEYTKFTNSWIKWMKHYSHNCNIIDKLYYLTLYYSMWRWMENTILRGGGWVFTVYVRYASSKYLYINSHCHILTFEGVWQSVVKNVKRVISVQLLLLCLLVWL